MTILDLYKKVYLIRKAEERICQLYPEDKMKTPMHMSMGGEAISAGVCQALNKEDQVLGSCRSHALYLSKTGETDEFFAEMFGKATGGSKGKAGSMHLNSPENGLMSTLAIVSGGISVAVGAAFANKRIKNNKITAIFFGDGAIEEGCFWESINIACLMELPILFICEDNGFAKNTPISKRHGYESISEIASKFRCNVFEEEGVDAEVVYNTTKKALDIMKENRMPCFLHFNYYRYLEHVGVNQYFDEYRPKEEFEEWRKKDPVELLRKRVSEEDAVRIEKEDEQIEKSISLAESAPFAGKEEAHKDIFYEKDKL